MIRPVIRILWNPAIYIGPMLGRSRQIILYYTRKKFVMFWNLLLSLIETQTNRKFNLYQISRQLRIEHYFIFFQSYSDLEAGGHQPQKSQWQDHGLNCKLLVSQAQHYTTDPPLTLVDVGINRSICNISSMFLLVLYSPNPSFEAVYCYICGRWRVAVAWYRMICLVLTQVSTWISSDSL